MGGGSVWAPNFYGPVIGSADDMLREMDRRLGTYGTGFSTSMGQGV